MANNKADKSIYLDDEKYISSKEASKLTGYTHDYIGQLCRAGKVEGKLFGRTRYVSEASILKYKKEGGNGNLAQSEKVNSPIISGGVVRGTTQKEIENISETTQEIIKDEIIDEPIPLIKKENRDLLSPYISKLPIVWSKKALTIAMAILVFSGGYFFSDKMVTKVSSIPRESIEKKIVEIMDDKKQEANENLVFVKTLAKKTNNSIDSFYIEAKEADNSIESFFNLTKKITAGTFNQTKRLAKNTNFIFNESYEGFRIALDESQKGFKIILNEVYEYPKNLNNLITQSYQGSKIVLSERRNELLAQATGYENQNLNTLEQTAVGTYRFINNLLFSGTPTVIVEEEKTYSNEDEEITDGGRSSAEQSGVRGATSGSDFEVYPTQTQTKIIYQPRPTSPAGELGGGQVIERVIQTFSGVTLQDLQKLKNELLQEIYRVADNSSPTMNLASNYAAIALTNKIDQLTSVTINNSTINNPTITGATVSGSTLTLTGSITANSGIFSGGLSTGGNLSSTGILTISSTATSTIAGNLDIAGNLKLDGSFYDTNNQNGTSGQFLTSTVSGTDWVTLSTTAIQDADSDTMIQVEETSDEDKIRFDTAGSERMIIDENGNIGVGTTSPLTKLSLEGTAGTPLMNIASSTGASVLYIDEYDRVGMGETSPTAKLHIQGSGSTSNTYGLKIYNSLGTNLLYTGDDGTFNFGGNLLIDEANNRVGINQTSLTNPFQVGYSVAETDAIPVMTSNTAPIGIAFASESSTNAWKSFDDGTTYWSNNSSPVELGYEFNTSKIIVKYFIKGHPSNPLSAPEDWIFEGWNGTSWVVLDTQTGQSTLVVGSGHSYTVSNSTAYLKYRIYITAHGGSTARVDDFQMFEDQSYLTGFVLSSDGYVGIGTTSPLTKFSLQGTAGTPLMNIASSTGASVLYIDEYGRVGIGTTDYSSDIAGDLDFKISMANNMQWGVKDNSGGEGWTELSNGTITGISHLNETQGYVIGTASNHDLTFRAHNSENAVSIQNNAKVIIQHNNTPNTAFSSAEAQLDVRIQAAGTEGFSVRGASSQSADYFNISSLGGDDDIMTVLSSGNVGIATTTPWRTLSVNGTAAFTGLSTDGGAGFYACVHPTTGELATSTGACGGSSERFKKNIETLTYGINEVLQLEPVSFNWKEEVMNNKTKQIGLIAEQVEPIIPEIVRYDSEGRVASLDYPKFTVVIINAIKEIWNEIIDIKTRLTALENIVGNSLASVSEFVVDKISSKVIYTTQLCIEDLCIGKDEFKKILLSAGVEGNIANVGSAGVDAGEELPTITIQGNNPAQIELNSIYIDMGAIAKDSNGNDLSIIVSVFKSFVSASLDPSQTGDSEAVQEGINISDISLDTSTSTTYTIIYETTDGNGNTAEIERIVIVGDLNPTDGQEEEEETQPEEPLPTSPAGEVDGGQATEPETPEPQEETSTTTPEIIEESETPELTCDTDNLNLCTIQTECEEVPAYWYNNSCNIEEEVIVEEPQPEEPEETEETSTTTPEVIE